MKPNEIDEIRELFRLNVRCDAGSTTNEDVIALCVYAKELEKEYLQLKEGYTALRVKRSLERSALRKLVDAGGMMMRDEPTAPQFMWPAICKAKAMLDGEKPKLKGYHDVEEFYKDDPEPCPECGHTESEE